MSKVLTLALGLTLGSCAIQTEALYEVVAVRIDAPDVCELWSAHTFHRTDIQMKNDSVYFWEAVGEHNKMVVTEVIHQDSIQDFVHGDNFEGVPFEMSFAEGDATITYILFDLENRYE